MNTAKNRNILKIYFDTYHIPLGIFDQDGNLVMLYSMFGERLTRLYIQDARKIWEETRGNTFPGLGLDENGSCWLDMPLGKNRLLFGPVQIGLSRNFPYENVDEYSQKTFLKVSEALVKLISGANVKIVMRTYESQDIEIAKTHMRDPLEYVVNGFHDAFTCIKNGDVEQLEQLLNSGTILTFMEGTMMDMEAAKEMFLFNLAKCYYFSEAGGLSISYIMPMLGQYTKELRTLSTVSSIHAAMLRIMYAFAKQVRHFSDESKSNVVKKAKSYILDHVYETILIPDISDFCSTNLSTLQHRFKEETGESLSDAIQQAKMEKAQFFLRYTSMSITDIAFRLSYCSQSYFSKQFRKHFGMTPMAYRKAI